jgi:hypothetical protein
MVQKLTIAGYVATFCCIVQVIFQLCLALGASWGNAAWGGGSQDLSTEFRIASAVNALLWCFASVVALQRSKLRPTIGFGDSFCRGAAWFFTVLFGFSTLLNFASQSPLERYMWAPFALICTISFYVVARGDGPSGTSCSEEGLVATEGSNIFS